MLEELCKQDELWRNYAFKICGCREQADDLVQEMYLKFNNKDKEISKRYIYESIRTVYIDTLRKESKTKLISIEDLYRDLTHDEIDVLQERVELLDMIKELSFFDREVLLLTHEYSLRDAEKVSNVPYYTLNYYKKKGLKKLKEKYGRTKR